MSFQRQHFLLSYLKTLSVGPVGVRTRDIPLSRPAFSLTEPTRAAVKTKLSSGRDRCQSGVSSLLFIEFFAFFPYK